MSVDIEGAKAIGEVAKAIPEKSWNRLVETACSTFEKSLAPFTELTSGLGRLISAKFDRFVEIEKILAVEAIESANLKVAASGRLPKGNPKTAVVLKAIEQSSQETDFNMRELWSNLLAQEMLEGAVHPEVANILSRLAAEDARTLAGIAFKHPDKNRIKSFIKFFGDSLPGGGIVSIGMAAIERPDISFSEKLLETLNLIENVDGKWLLTPIGEGFIKCVTDPSKSE